MPARAEELAEIESALGAARGSVQVGFNRRFAPPACELKQLLAATPGPEDRRASASWPARSIRRTGMRTIAESGGRILGEACHFLDFFCFLFEPKPVRVCAQTAVARRTAACPSPTAFAVQVEFDGRLVRPAPLHGRGRPQLAEGSVHGVRRRHHAEIENFQRLAVRRSRKRPSSASHGKGHAEQMRGWAAFLAARRRIPCDSSTRCKHAADVCRARVDPRTRGRQPVTERRPGVLFVVNSLAAGGAERQVISLLNHLDTRRFRLHLAYLRPSEALLERLDASRLDAVECAAVSGRLDPRAVGRLQRLVQAREIDLIVSTNTFSTLYGALARMASARTPKLLAVFHTTALYTSKQRLAMRFFRHVFARCDRLVYVCENQRAFWHTRGLRARSDAVVHNGIDVAHFADQLTAAEKRALRARLGFGADDYVVGLCGALRPEKAHGDLLRAVATLRARGLPVTALLIGEGPQRPDIERTAASLGIADSVRITGFQADVRPFIAACDVMTLVSHAIETFSLAALESMACAKPLVMTDIGGASEQIAHGVHGLLYAPGDVEALANHLQTLADGRVREVMGAAAAERVRRCFTLPRMVNGFEREFDDVLGGGALTAPTRATREISGSS